MDFVGSFRRPQLPSRGMKASRLRRAARTILRPIRRGWPDEGRILVQGPHLRKMLARGGAPGGILNAGSGEGLFSQMLLAVAGAGFVLEIDYSYRSHPRPARDPRQGIAAASLTAIPARAGSFGLVLCTEVLEHIEDDGAALTELRRVLAPGGFLIVTVPTLDSVYDPNHVRTGYAAEKLSATLQSLGLEILEVEFCMHAAFKALMRAVRLFDRIPRALIWLLAFADRLCPVGAPMDLMILTHLPATDALEDSAPAAIAAAATRSGKTAFGGNHI
jgi:SAM-dependent methyltransferase